MRILILYSAVQAVACHISDIAVSDSATTTTTTTSSTTSMSTTVVSTSSTTTPIPVDTERERYIDQAVRRAMLSHNITDPEMIRVVRAQSIEDHYNQQVQPMLLERTREASHEGDIELGSRVYRGMFSTLFRIVDQPQRLIKYQIDYQEYLGGHQQMIIHPLVREWTYMREAFALGVAPRPIFLSPGTLLPPAGSISPKTNFYAEPTVVDRLRQTSRQVRFMIMEKMEGHTIHQLRHYFTSGALPFRGAIKIGIELVRALQTLHEQGRIVHGDIHSGNVIMRSSLRAIQPNRPTDRIRVGLIDFGIAERIPEDGYPEAPVFAPGFQYHHLYTHWEIVGFASAMRDDLFRAIEVVAASMNTHSYWFYVKDLLLKDDTEAMEWKMNGFLFANPKSSYNPIEALNVPDDVRGKIRTALETVLATVRSGAFEAVNARRDYETIIANFQAILELLQPFRNAEPILVSETMEQLERRNRPWSA